MCWSLISNSNTACLAVCQTHMCCCGSSWSAPKCNAVSVTWIPTHMFISALFARPRPYLLVYLGASAMRWACRVVCSMRKQLQILSNRFCPPLEQWTLKRMKCKCRLQWYACIYNEAFTYAPSTSFALWCTCNVGLVGHISGKAVVNAKQFCAQLITNNCICITLCCEIIGKTLS